MTIAPPTGISTQLSDRESRLAGASLRIKTGTPTGHLGGPELAGLPGCAVPAGHVAPLSGPVSDRWSAKILNERGLSAMSSHLW